ncbi:hypothetical protein E2P81_ATG02398 [Venturia nashicola]|nr:hypothetical protein E2P81_ATG02398 [Venturia nashicola]
MAHMLLEFGRWDPPTPRTRAREGEIFYYEIKKALLAGCLKLETLLQQLWLNLSSIVFHLLPTCHGGNTLFPLHHIKRRRAHRVDDATPTQHTAIARGPNPRRVKQESPGEATTSDREFHFWLQRKNGVLMTPEEKIVENGLQLQRRLK